MTRLFHGAAQFWRGGALVALLVLCGFMYRAYTLPEVYESETLVEMANEREQSAGGEGLRTAVFDPRTIEQVALETASHVQREADKPGPSVIDRTRSSIDLRPMGDGKFQLTFRASSAPLARKGCATIVTEASQRLIASRPSPLSPQEEARQRNKIVEEKTRELAAFVAQHPELAGKKSETGEAFLGVPGMRPPSTPAPAPTTDTVLPILLQQKTRLEERLAFVEKQELGGGDEPDKLPPGDALARMDRASLQKMLVQVKAAIAARQAAAERARANTPQPETPPETTVTEGAPIQAEWQRLVQAVVDAQQQAASARVGDAAPAIHVVRSANTPASPISPNRRLFALLGATAGLWVGILYAFARVAMGHARAIAPTQYKPEGLPAFPLEGEATAAPAETTSASRLAAAKAPPSPASETAASPAAGALPAFPIEGDATADATSASRLAAAKAAPPPKPATTTAAPAPTVPAAVPSSPVAVPPPPKMREALPSFPMDADLAKAVDEATAASRGAPAKAPPETEGLARPTPAKPLPETEGLARPTPAQPSAEAKGEIISTPPPPMPLQESDSLPKVIIADEATATAPATHASQPTSPAAAAPAPHPPPPPTGTAVPVVPPSAPAVPPPPPAVAAPPPPPPAVAAQPPPPAAVAPAAPPPPPPAAAAAKPAPLTPTAVEARRPQAPSFPADAERGARADDPRRPQAPSFFETDRGARAEAGRPMLVVDHAQNAASNPPVRSPYAAVAEAARGGSVAPPADPPATVLPAVTAERKPSRHPSWTAEAEATHASHRSKHNHESHANAAGDGRIQASPIMGIEEGMATAASGKQGISVYPPPVAPIPPIPAIPPGATPGGTLRIGSTFPEMGSSQPGRRSTQAFGSPVGMSPSTAPGVWTPPATFGTHQMPPRESEPPPGLASIPPPPKNPSHIGPVPAVQSYPASPARGPMLQTGATVVESASTALALAKPHSSRTRSEPPAASSVVCDVPKGWSPHPTLVDSEHSEELAALRDQLYRLATRECFVVGVSSGPEMAAYKSGVAARLAWMLAQPGHARILLMEGDFDHPVVHRLMRIDMPIASGFSEQMRRRMNGSPPGPWTIVRCAPNLYVLAEGLVRSPGLLPTVHFADSVNELRRAYDLIVIDAPAGGMSVDTRAIDAVADGIVLAGEADLLDRASGWFSKKQLTAVVSAGHVAPNSR